MVGIPQSVAEFVAESPGAQYLILSLAGLLGALVNVALEGEPILLPRIEDHQLHLGFGGNLIICITVALLVDHNFQMAFFAALCGTVTLRSLKAKLERAFREEIDKLYTEE